jgi:hypothetical protein
VTEVPIIVDADKLLEKLIKWLSDPKGREMVKTVLYLVFPLFLVLALRSATRRRPAAEKSSLAIKPKIRPPTTESMTISENVKETMAREQKKIAREMQEVFGREDRLLTRAKKQFNKSPEPQKSSPVESSEVNEKKMLQEELLKLFSRRPN